MISGFIFSSLRTFSYFSSKSSLLAEILESESSFDFLTFSFGRSDKNYDFSFFGLASLSLLFYENPEFLILASDLKEGS